LILSNLTKISAVSYLNTLPFLHGIEHSAELREIGYVLSTDIPSVCAQKVVSGEADLGLIPVAAIPQISDYQIIGDFCIGALSEVKTVLLLSHVPLTKIQRVLLDYQSRTSVMLVQVLAKHFWNITPEFLPAKLGFESEISGTTAGVVIGDRIFAIPKQKYSYRYDLSLEWHKMTCLPFVFAAWVANKPISHRFSDAFNNALAFGIQHIPEVAEKYSSEHPNHQIPLYQYYTEDISYYLDSEKRKAISLFLKLADDI
jgi:chorismate dehydratase